MAVMMPTNYSVVQCIKVLITHCVNPNLKALVITIKYLLHYINKCIDTLKLIVP
jgi:hypothetical protein